MNEEDVSLLKDLVEIAIFITVCIIVGFSSKDPFKSHIIGNMTNYFNTFPSSNTSLIKSICICKNETFDNTCTNENDFHGCFNVSSDIINFQPLIKRKLESDSFCTDIRESFSRNKGKKLSYIFDLNYTTIRRLSIALMVVCVSYIAISIIKWCIKDSKKYKEGKNIILNNILFFVNVLKLIAWIAKFVLSLILFHFIENSDIGKYDSFLECPYVKEKYFKKFNDVNKFRKCFLAFGILNIISESIEEAKDLFKKCDKLDKSESKVENKDESKVESNGEIKIENKGEVEGNAEDSNINSIKNI